MTTACQKRLQVYIFSLMEISSCANKKMEKTHKSDRSPTTGLPTKRCNATKGLMELNSLAKVEKLTEVIIGGYYLRPRPD
jgi:hypothetical protein